MSLHAGASPFSRRPAAILYDHDGTVVDTLAGVVAATNDVLVAHGHAPVPAATIIDGMRLPTCPRMGQHAGSNDPAHQRVLAAAFFVRFASCTPALARVYPGMRDLLRDAHAAGLPQGIVSNNQGAALRVIISSLGLDACLRFVLGEEDLPALKPHPDGLRAAAARLGHAPADCVYIGDSPVDAAAAHAAGMPALGVTWGTHTAADLHAAGFTALAGDPAMLRTWFGLP